MLTQAYAHARRYPGRPASVAHNRRQLARCRRARRQSAGSACATLRTLLRTPPGCSPRPLPHALPPRLQLRGCAHGHSSLNPLIPTLPSLPPLHPHPLQLQSLTYSLLPCSARPQPRERHLAVPVCRRGCPLRLAAGRRTQETGRQLLRRCCSSGERCRCARAWSTSASRSTQATPPSTSSVR